MPEFAATLAVRPTTNDTQLTRDQKEELMKQQFDAEDKSAKSSVSTSINGLSEIGFLAK
jgi:hypothetical protein